jgi:hypothetical protein
MSIKRLNYFAGPACGKSVMAATVFSRLKIENKNVELISEYAKELAFAKIKIQPYDQLKIFAEQVSREYRVLNSDPTIVTISDSPLPLSVVYAKKYQFRSYRHLVSIFQDFELEYPSLNFFLERNDCAFSQVGRYENYEECLHMDREIKTFLQEYQIPFIEVAYNDVDTVMQKINLFL